MTKPRIDHELGQSATKALRFFAWIMLLGGIVGAIFILSEFGTIEVQGRFSSTTEVNSVAVAFAISVFLQSAILCALLLVISYIAENIASLQIHFVPVEELHENRNASQSATAEKASDDPNWKWKCSKCGGPVKANYGSGEQPICKSCAMAS